MFYYILLFMCTWTLVDQSDLEYQYNITMNILLLLSIYSISMITVIVIIILYELLYRKAV